MTWIKKNVGFEPEYYLPKNKKNMSTYLIKAHTDWTKNFKFDGVVLLCKVTETSLEMMQEYQKIQ